MATSRTREERAQDPIITERTRNDPEDRIVTHAPYGEHIPLTCRNHRHLRWPTKNISFIGARTIFFDLMGECHAPEGSTIDDRESERECRCSAFDLVALAPTHND